MPSLMDRMRAFISPPASAVKAADKRTLSRRTPRQTEEVRAMMRDVIRASYDSVVTTRENERHWSGADYMSADSILTPYVREKLRSQSRYELQENNSYGRGIVDSVVTDTIGTGPRLQITAFDQKTNQEVEKAFHRWAEATCFTDKLTTLRTARLVDGETVFRFINNLTVDDPVQLDIQLIECDQLRSPQFENYISEFYVDGVHLDRFSNPYAYDILRHHPGARYWTSVDYFAYDTYSYDEVVHTFKQNRPGQHRGIPEFAPALPLFAFLRRFTLATVSAAETAASVSQVIETDAPLPEELEEEYAVANFEKYWDTIPIDRNSATILPNLWKLKQFAAEHPTTTYAMFKREIIAEIGRCCCVPVNVGSLDSGQANFSSTKFDWLSYERKVETEQKFTSKRDVDRVFGEWLLEAALVDAIPRRTGNQVRRHFEQWGKKGLITHIEHEWHWDGLRDASEKEAADAETVRLKNGTTHRARQYAKLGLDMEVEDRKAAEGFGVSVEEYRKWLMASIFTNGNLLQQEQEQQLSNEGSTQGGDDGDEGEESGSARSAESQTATA